MTHKQPFKFYIASCEPDGGIYECIYSDGEAEIKSVIPLDRPMYMIISDGKMHAIIRDCFEKSQSGIITFDISGEEAVQTGETVCTCGVVACHLCRLENSIYAVNYLSGSLTKLGETTVIHSGKGINPKRQEMPHTHFVESFDGKYLLCTDLGTDEIYVYDKDLNEISRVKVPEGHGPRHLAYKDGYVYCANELASTVSVFEYSDGVISLKDTVSVLPDGFEGETTVAAIRIKGDLVYVSNRGHDSISVLKINGSSVEFIEAVPCGGESPRDFDIFGNLLICTNEVSGNVTFFDLKDGIPVRNSAELKVRSALCVAAE